MAFLALLVFGWGGAKSTRTPSSIKALKKELYVLGAVEDKSNSLTHKQLAKLNDGEFKFVGEAPAFGFTAAHQWIKLRVFNFDDHKAGRILEVNNPILNKCNLYEIKGNEAVLLYSAGDDGPFSKRPIAHLNYQFPLEMMPNSTREFLLQVSSGGEQLQVPMGLWSTTDITLRDEKDRLLRGVYFGIILFVLLFNLFIYIIIKERSSMYYVAYVFFLMMLQLSLGGFAYRYFWPESSYLANVANPFFASLSIFALIRFSQTFLQLYQFYPKLNRAFTLSGYLVAANAVLALVYTPSTFQISVLVINIVALILNIMIIPTAVLVIRKGFKPGRYFLAAFLVLVVSVFFFILNNFGAFESEFYAAYGLQFGSAVEVILLSFAIVDKFKRFREEAFERLVTINSMKARANEELERKVVERTEEIVAQKVVVEQQKEEIVASIRYAERIQQSLLPAEQEIQKLFADNFVLFKPRDIVSGDFYWFGRTHEEYPWMDGLPLRLFAAIDCTGHGVPGALMSVMAHNALDRCTTQSDVKNPADALRFINDEIVRNLQHEKHDKSVQDGMDMVLCAYDPVARKLHFAGAKNNLYIFRNGEVLEAKGDRRSIGAELSEDANVFALHTLKLEKGDALYTFTDGFPDQFGGALNKKLKSKPLLGIIAELAHHTMEEQCALLTRTFELWRGENEQIDDVCMLGIRVD